MLSEEQFMARMSKRLEKYKDFPDCKAVRISIVEEVKDEIRQIIKEERQEG